MTGAEERARIDNLQAKLDDYWEVFEPLFDWTAVEKSTQSFRFLRREVLPRREAALAIAQDIEQFNNANLSAQRAEVTRRFASFQRGLHALLWQSLALGVLVALTAVIRLRIVERRTVEQRLLAEEAERQLRQLSQQLVATQEEERKKLSRELHDHVGQMLTALRMELGRIDRVRGPVDAEIRGRRRRMPAARRQRGPDRPRPVARASPQHARRLRPAARARMAHPRRQPSLSG